MRISTFLCSISLFLFYMTANAQQDSISYQERYGLSLGIDLNKATRSIYDEDFQGVQLYGDYRLTDEVFLAAEIGADDVIYRNPVLVKNTTGSYLKLGANWNVYDNWIGMQNQIYVGGRLGVSSFSHELQEFEISTRDNFFGEDIRSVDREFNDLFATWVEMQLGIRVELVKNIFLGAHIQFKARTSETEVNNFDHLYIPGFFETSDSSSFGVGWGYTLSYLIPFRKELKKQAVNN